MATKNTVQFEVDIVMEVLDTIRQYATNITLHPISGAIIATFERDDDFTAGQMAEQVRAEIDTISCARVEKMFRVKAGA